MIQPKDVNKGDKRNFPRYVVSKRYPLTVASALIYPEAKEDKEEQKEQEYAEPISGYVTDINASGTGMGLVIAKRIEPKTEIKLELNGLPFAVCVKGMVAWTAGFPVSGRVIKPLGDMKWRIGIHLNPENPEQEEVLKKVVKKLI
ncbi:MAG: hypothetical protein AB7F43_14145 [Bacteriovoracia bacterium]